MPGLFDDCIVRIQVPVARADGQVAGQPELHQVWAGSRQAFLSWQHAGVIMCKCCMMSEAQHVPDEPVYRKSSSDTHSVLYDNMHSLSHLVNLIMACPHDD